MCTAKRTMLTTMAMLVLRCAAASGADYYTAQQDPAASDANAGSFAQPWKTMGRSLTTLEAGDTLYVRAGVYRETIMLASNGWSFAGISAPPFAGGTGVAAPVRFLAYPGDEVVLKGSDVVTGWTPYTNAVWVKTNWTFNSQQVFCDGAVLRQIGGVMPPGLQEPWLGEDRNKGFGDLAPGTFFYDRAQKRLYVWLPDGGDPNRHLMEAGARPFLFTIGVDFVHVAGFKMMHGDVGSKVNWPSVHVNGAFNVLEDCEVSWCDYIAVSLSGHNNTVRRCRLNDNGNAGLAGGGWGNQLLDCQLARNNYRHWSAGWGAGGMKVIPGAHAWLVSGCVAESNRWSDGIWFDAFNAHVTIQNCLMRHNDGSGIHYEISERAIIRNNIAYENKGRGIYLSNSSDSIVLHNLCYRNGMAGIAVHGVNRPGGATADPETGYAPARNNVIWGNILMDNCHPDLCPDDPDHTGQSWSLRPELIVPDPRIASNAGCVSDYNLFYRSDGRPMPFWENWGAAIYADLEEWQAKTGQDRHSLIAEPRFADLVAHDFHPTPDSPAVHMVRQQMSIRQDRDGRDRMFRTAFLTAGPYEAPQPSQAKKPPATDVPLHLRTALRRVHHRHNRLPGSAPSVRLQPPDHVASLLPQQPPALEEALPHRQRVPA